MCNPATATPQLTNPVVTAKDSGGSIWSEIGRVAGKAFAAPFRSASSLVNASIFGAYYVSTLAISGVALTGSALSAPVRLAVDRASGKNSGKSLSEYVISPAKKTYNYISRLYNELPDHASEKIFAGIAIVAVAAMAIIATVSNSGSNRGGTFVFIDAGTNHYHYGPRGRHTDSNDDSYFSRMLRPYKVFTDIGVASMDKTTKFIDGSNSVE